MSGLDLGDVRVHRDSARPTTLGAAAYTQGEDIHLGPGQEEHLAHEAWHVVQQKQGRVRPTARLDGTDVGDAPDLEAEADAMATRVLTGPAAPGEQVGGERRRVGGGRGTVQLKWGRHDGSDRDAVRGILEKVGRLQPFPYELAGVLEDLLHHEDATESAVEALVRDLGDHVTTGERAKALIAAREGGLSADFAARAAETEADDQALVPLLGLMVEVAAATPAPPSPDVLRVASALLAGGRPVLDLADAVLHVPDLLTTPERAGAVVDHRMAGGSADDARLAAVVAPDDAAAFANALTAVRALGTLAEFGQLPPDTRRALLEERQHLTTDPLREAAVAAVRSVEPASAAGVLARTRAFGYREDVEAHVGARATEHADKVVAEEKKAATGVADTARAKAIADQEGPASTSSDLKRDHRKNLVSASKDSARYVEAVKARLVVQKSLAADDIAAATRTEEAAHQKSDDETRPRAKQDRTDQYTTFLASVGHHPQALAAIKAAQEDLTLARRVLTALDADARLAALLLDPVLTPALLTNVLTVSAAALGTLVGGGLTPKDVAAYGVSIKHAALLGDLAAKNAPVPHVQSLVAQLAQFSDDIGNDQERGSLATLLVHAPAATVRSLRLALPQVVTSRLTLLAPIVPKAADPADLVPLIRFTDKAGWTGPLISGTFAPLGVGLSANALEDAVYVTEATRFDKELEFASWLYAIDRLVEVGYLKIVQKKTWKALPATPPTIPTDQLKYLLQPVRGAYTDFFVVHDHPTLKAGQVGPYGSKNHLKPRRRSDQHYRTPKLLTTIFKKIQMQRP